MKIISWNVNGLRSVYRKNFLEWLKIANPDFLCLQEVKADLEQLPEEVLKVAGYNLVCNSALKKGYAGTAVYSKEKPKAINNKLGFSKFDQEGRYLELQFQDFILINVYLPHGGRKKEKLEYKLESYNHLIDKLKEIKDQPIVLAGDFNIAHTELDLARPKDNKNNIMFTPEEREKLGQLMEVGFIDTFRKLHSEGENYTWWPYYNNARERNLGWRIDYIFVNKVLEKRLIETSIQKNTLGSDHCPTEITLK